VGKNTRISSIPYATQLIAAAKIIVGLEAAAEVMGVGYCRRVCSSRQRSETCDDECLDHFEPDFRQHIIELLISCILYILPCYELKILNICTATLAFIELLNDQIRLKLPCLLQTTPRQRG
jgi:hypothetical protein